MAEAEIYSDEYGNQYYNSYYSPEYLNALEAPCECFLLPLSHNVYNVNFVNFRIRSMDEGNEHMIFDIGGGSRPSPPPPHIAGTADQARFIRYHFGPDLLDCRMIGTTLEFVNGDYPLHNFRMIERHYFRGSLITSYDFTMPFIIPGSKNNWEMIYENPLFQNPEWKEAMRDPSAAWEWKSDSFYYVDEVDEHGNPTGQSRLIMHNRAEYNCSM
eukprot:TRINITY_DN108368_c0_g1_i1.p1 TRINITY_DN108368_c0_g1~~TRINITY_DN108368_c0_g1_i1.p1  ORF type:complete len:242 (+),score=34.52 TRINITY_DN108368_c0_g1_i1:85-726(+)